MFKASFPRFFQEKNNRFYKKTFYTSKRTDSLIIFSKKDQNIIYTTHATTTITIRAL